MIAVITGDIINSSKVSSPEIYLSILKEELQKLGSEPHDWEIYRGDSFQVQTNPVDALEKAILIKAAIKTIKNLDVKLAIGIGQKNFLAQKITESNGESFVRSGRLFEETKQNIALSTGNQDFDKEMNLLLQVALTFMDEWSDKSAEIIRLSFQYEDLTQKAFGEKMGLKQSSVSERRKTANYEAVLLIISNFRNKIAHGTFN